VAVVSLSWLCGLVQNPEPMRSVGPVGQGRSGRSWVVGQGGPVVGQGGPVVAVGLRSGLLVVSVVSLSVGPVVVP